jgi:hypothetical protein
MHTYLVQMHECDQWQYFEFVVYAASPDAAIALLHRQWPETEYSAAQWDSGYDIQCIDERAEEVIVGAHLLSHPVKTAESQALIGGA